MVAIIEFTDERALNGGPQIRKVRKFQWWEYLLPCNWGWSKVTPSTSTPVPVAQLRMSAARQDYCRLLQCNMLSNEKPEDLTSVVVKPPFYLEPDND